MVRRRLAVEAAGGRATFVTCDVAVPQTARRWSRRRRRYGRLDFAHNNAGMMAYGIPRTSTDELWDAIMEVNLKGIWLSLKSEFQQMRRRARARSSTPRRCSGIIGARAPTSPASTASSG